MIKRENITLFIIVTMLCAALIISFVSAEQGSGNGNSREKKEIRIEKDGVEKRIEIEKRNGEERIRIRIKGSNEDEIDAVSVRTELEIEEEIENGKRILKARLKNGRMAKISILPDEVLEKALAEFETDLFDISLEERNDKIRYKIKAIKKARLLGLFDTDVEIESEVDSETGAVLNKRKPWWAFLAIGEDSNQIGKKVTICHIPPGNPGAAHTLSVGGPAVRAHLAHGDTLGECASGGTGNQTNMTLPGMNNTNITIPGMNNTNMTIPNLNNTNITIPGMNNTNITMPGTNNTNSTGNSS